MVNMTASYFAAHFPLKAISNCQIFPAVTRGLPTSQNLSTIFFYHRTPYTDVIICNGSDKQQRRGGTILNFTKGETFLVSYKNELLFEVSPCTLLFSQSSFRKTTILPPSVWPNGEFTWTIILKKSLLICFESYWISSIPTGKVLMLMVILQHFVNS